MDLHMIGFQTLSQFSMSCLIQCELSLLLTEARRAACNSTPFLCRGTLRATVLSCFRSL